MRMPLLATVALAAILAAGCRTRPEQRAMFESYQEEARRLEGRIYDLEYDNAVLCDENERLKKRLEKLALGKPERVDEGPRVIPRSMRSDGSTAPDIDLTPPEIDLGPPSTPEGTNKPVTPESELPDVDSPPGESAPEPPSDDPPDEPPPRPASILKLPASESLPAPRPSTKPKAAAAPPSKWTRHQSPKSDPTAAPCDHRTPTPLARR